MLFVSAEFLYWQAQANGLPYVLSTQVKDPHFEWDEGGRVTIGYRFERDLWELSLTGLRMHNDAHAHEQGHLTPIWTTAGSGFIDKASVHWRLHFGLLDLELARHFATSTVLFLRPHVGVRAASIRQKDNIVYEGGSLFPNKPERVRMKNKFFGVGLRCGMDAEWMLTRNFSLVSTTGFSLLSGEFYIHQDENRLGLHYQFPGMSSILDLGLKAVYVWKKLSLFAGWEQTFLFGQNQLFRFTSSKACFSNQGDIALRGFSLGFKYNF